MGIEDEGQVFPMSEWQPIETAPKDGRDFLAVDSWEDDGEIINLWLVGYFHKGANRFHYGSADEDHFVVDHTPTHWMPLPEPPQ